MRRRAGSPAPRTTAEGETLTNGGVESDAKGLLAALAGKEGARRGEPVAVGTEAAGFGADPSGERLARAVWRLIAEGALEAVMEPGAPAGEEPGAVYRLTRVGLEELRDA